MDAESTTLLNAFWSWVSGGAGVLLLGVLLPVSVGLLLGFAPLVVARRDWRSIPGALLAIGMFLIGGAAALSQVHRPAPHVDFWLAMSLQIGGIVLVVSTVAFFRIARRRLRRDRDALATILDATPAHDVVGAAAREPGSRRRLTGIEAEYYVAEWMRFLGATESVVTPARRDGGIDVRSDHYVAQVKHRPGDFVSVDVVRALIGVASLENRTPVVFTSGRYSSDAYQEAGRAGVALFIFRPAEGRLIGANAAAHALRQHGMRGRESGSTAASSVVRA